MSYGGYDAGGSSYGGGYGGGYGGSSSSSSDDNSEVDTVYVEGLQPQCTEQDLIKFFGSIGILKKKKKKGERVKTEVIWLYKNKQTGQNKGDGTVSYEDPESARAAVKWFNEKEFMGNTIKVSLSTWKKEAPVGGFRGGGGGYGGGRGGYGGGGRGGYGGGG
eukprot:CAMPEP_0175142306 /NCGR_PEP_ID=MMETSP0087-20121206/12712_1 /TAXON_ID=136419 /ORGANISM="Unknown Unknown, Strain D1" /LENGTH=161 /DNA_ID=CAMNT_0016426067 /DNA_START=39 /DNA_END=521 /DNA_ORIENTATION=+